MLRNNKQSQFCIEKNDDIMKFLQKDLLRLIKKEKLKMEQVEKILILFLEISFEEEFTGFSSVPQLLIKNEVILEIYLQLLKKFNKFYRFEDREGVERLVSTHLNYLFTGVINSFYNESIFAKINAIPIFLSILKRNNSETFDTNMSEFLGKIGSQHMTNPQMKKILKEFIQTTNSSEDDNSFYKNLLDSLVNMISG
jgi:hypothetical protein